MWKVNAIGTQIPNNPIPFINIGEIAFCVESSVYRIDDHVVPN